MSLHAARSLGLLTAITQQACATDRSSMAMAALHLSTAGASNHAVATRSGAVKSQCASGNGNVVVRAFEAKDRICGGVQLWRTKDSGLVVRRSVEGATAGGVTEVEKDTFWPFVKDAAEKVVVLDMYTQWCGPCKLMLPKVIALSATYDDVVFAKLDCNQDNKALAKELGVKTVPTFKIFKNAEVVAEIRGAKYDDLVSAIESARSSS
jgi:thioredoxin 1